ncbi:MAG TPA: hypothetical protein VE993_20180 [Stellaceae bacterium]|nr:hypothetical protein [Stellaceae bacterium]
MIDETTVANAKEQQAMCPAALACLFRFMAQNGTHAEIGGADSVSVGVFAIEAARMQPSAPPAGFRPL